MKLTPGHSARPPPPATTLQERIARLKLGGDASAPSVSSSTPAPRQTGAKGRISDKIGKFQANAEEAPLIPQGSFSLGGARREPSSGREEKGRVASLGGGRANVPLGVVTTPRSVSTGSPRTPRSEAGSTGSGGGGISPASSRASTPALADSVATIEPEPTSYPLPPAFERADSAVSSGARTPGALSVSSLSVEEGSYTSEGGPDPSSISLSEATIAASPLSSPRLTAISVEQADLPSLPSSPTFASPPASLKTPLDSLRAPLRSPSSLSVSSMQVEVGDETEGEGAASAMSGIETPRGEEAPLPEVVGGSDAGSESGVGAPMSVDEDEEVAAAREKAREEATKAELDEYEKETTDATAPHPVELVSTPTLSGSPETSRTALSDHPGEDSPKPDAAPETTMTDAVESAEEESEGGGGYGDILDDFAASEDGESKAEPSGEDSGMPKVKCSDCNQDVDLME